MSFVIVADSEQSVPNTMAGARALSVPKLKCCNVSSTSQCDRPLNVLKSLSKRHSFDSDEEN